MTTSTSAATDDDVFEDRPGRRRRTGMFDLNVGMAIDKQLYRLLLTLVQAVSGDFTRSGGGRAGTTIRRLAPADVVTPALMDYAYRAFELTRPRCEMCLSVTPRGAVLCVACARGVTASFVAGGVNVFDRDDMDAMCLSKAPYGSADYAHQLAAQRSAEHGVQLSVYLCPICGMHHLTRQPRAATAPVRGTHTTCLQCGCPIHKNDGEARFCCADHEAAWWADRQRLATVTSLTRQDFR
jgi:hypothetical protein